MAGVCASFSRKREKESHPTFLAHAIAMHELGPDPKDGFARNMTDISCSASCLAWRRWLGSLETPQATEMKTMNARVIAAASFGLVLLCAVPAAARPVTTTGETNLRQAAGTESPVLTLIPKGTSVDVGACSNGWCKVSWNGQEGYAIGKNLGIAPHNTQSGRAARPVGPVAAYDEDYGPPPGYVAVPPPPPPYYYYGYYGPYYGPGYWGRGWGWGRRW